jgi:hypothetical protein
MVSRVSISIALVACLGTCISAVAALRGNDRASDAIAEARRANAEASEANTYAADALALAKENEDRLNRQDSQQFASRIYLGEAPGPECQRHGDVQGDNICRVVINASGVQVENVWVENSEGLSITILGVQRCHMYALTPGFVHEHLYFSDPYGNWHRQYGGPLERLPDGELHAPDPDTGGDSVWDEPLQNCAG